MALDFDGVDDFVFHGDIAGIDGGSLLTAMCWLNPDTLKVGAGPLRKALNTTTISFQLNTDEVTNTSFRFEIGDGNYGVAATMLTAGTWGHVAGVYDGGGAANADRCKLYKDGANQTLSFTGTIPATMPDSGISNVISGIGITAANDFVDCKIALVKLWLAALTAAEVAQEMNSFRPARTANLILWSPYDDDTSARDYSGNGNHGTVTGALQAAGPPVSYGGAARLPLTPVLLAAMASGAMTRRDFLRRTAGAVPLLGR